MVVKTAERRLYLVLDNGKALRYGIGVGRQASAWAGQRTVMRGQWPGWTRPGDAPPSAAPARLHGGPENPLGARAMYIGSTYYRIHGSNEPWTKVKGVAGLPLLRAIQPPAPTRPYDASASAPGWS